jgi:ABC-type transport system involved in multi-copper enzyme maturation permease subunit
MNPFIKKEVRLLLPSWLAVLALAVVSPWLLWEDRDTALAGTPLFVFFGLILLAVDSFGREFSLGTFTSLMSQPMARRQIWRTKMTMLLCAAALIYLAYFLSCESLLLLSQTIPTPAINTLMLGQSFRHAALNAVVALVIALTGGLWTTILLRQISAAFWITFLVPLGLLVTLTFLLPARFQASGFYPPLLYCLAGIYCVAGFWLAHRLYHRSQDVAWTGGVIAFSRWRYFESGSKNAVTGRRLKPVLALFKKEFQLQSISLFCVGALLVLHLGVFLLRGFHGDHFEPNSMAGTISDFFWVFWLVLPLVIGCMAVAEERKLGVMESQFCLPVSRRTQFFIKFVPALITGVFLGGVMPLLLEYIAARFHLPASYLNERSFLGVNYLPGLDFFLLSIFLGVIGLALAGFLASTLAKHFMHALSIAIVILVAFFMFNVFLTSGRNLSNGEFIGAGRMLWGGVLPVLIGLPTILFFVPWLSYRNFSHFAETGRLWRRNVFGIAGALIFVFASSALIYNRAWEVFEPAEPPHGAAIFALSNPPKFQAGIYGGLTVQTPDGRVWYDSVRDDTYSEPQSHWQEFSHALLRPLPVSTGPAQFLDGSNWVSTTPVRYADEWYGTHHFRGFLESVGIKADGTLWISSDAKPSAWSGGVQSNGTLRISRELNPPAWNGGRMIQFGDETNWQQVAAGYGHDLLLLKTDGTLWEWKEGGVDPNGGWRTNWPSIRNRQPRQIGADSDWRQIYATWKFYAQKRDGSIWAETSASKTNLLEFERSPDMDSAMLSNSPWFVTSEAYIETNGTLWIPNMYSDQKGNSWRLKGYLQAGSDTNWVGVTANQPYLVALKKDGSLWSWNWQPNRIPTTEILKMPPTRFGIHSDWVGVASAWGGIFSLAADGSLWFWPVSGVYVPEGDQGALMKTQKQPKLIANIFSANN